MSNIRIQDIINWCDKKTEEGSELSLSWSGGNDEGWVEFFVDGIPSEEPEPEKLKDLMYQQINFFWFTGEFSASGEASYDASTRTFIGMDARTDEWCAVMGGEEGESDTTIESNIEVWLPINIQFDSIIIDTNDSDNYNCTVHVKIANLNGFLDPKYKRIENMLEKILPKQVELSLSHDGDDVRYYYHNHYEIQRESFIETDGFLLYYIKTFPVSKKIFTESKVEIDLAKILNDK